MAVSPRIRCIEQLHGPDVRLAAFQDEPDPVAEADVVVPR